MNDQNGGSSPYTVVSAGQVLVKTNDGAVMVFENGSPTSDAGQNIAQNLSGQTQVLGDTDIKIYNIDQIPVIRYQDAKKYFNEFRTVEGKILSAVDHLPKAVYLSFTDPYDGTMLVRIFNKDLSKFTYDPLTLLNKNVRVTGKITLYWPDVVDPEIIVTDPDQIQILSP